MEKWLIFDCIGRGTIAGTKTSKELSNMTTYALREPEWRHKEEENRDKTIYVFDSEPAFISYVKVVVKAHRNATIRYDSEKDTVYMEE